MSDTRLVTPSSLRIICKQGRRLGEDCATSDKVSDRIHRGISLNPQDSRFLDIALDSPIKAVKGFPSPEENIVGHAGLEFLQLSDQHQNMTGTQGQRETDQEKYFTKNQNSKEKTGTTSRHAYLVLPQDKPKATNLCGEFYSSSAQDDSECTVCQIPVNVMNCSADIWETNKVTTSQTGNGGGTKCADVAGHEDIVRQERGQWRLRGLDVFLILMTVILSVICVILSVTCFHLFTRVVSLEHYCKNDVNVRTSVSGRTTGDLVVHREVPLAMSDLVYTQKLPESPTAKQKFTLDLAAKSDKDSENLSRTVRSLWFDVSNSVPLPEAPSRSKREGGLSFKDLDDVYKDFEDKLIQFEEKCKRRSRSHLRTANFVGKFFDHFDYERDFFNKTDCLRNENWNHQNVACKETTIQFLKKGTPLPFFTPTNNKTKIIEQIHSPHGRFQVQSEGLYLIHFNITIKDKSRKHFLALYLNDVAVLACEGGGFACPKRGSDYRICNIHGVLELAKNDQVEIRTMHSNTTLRLELFRTPYFRFVRLMKGKKSGHKKRNKNTRNNKS